jgi:hypothetical protein
MNPSFATVTSSYFECRLSQPSDATVPFAGTYSALIQPW